MSQSGFRQAAWHEYSSGEYPRIIFFEHLTRIHTCTYAHTALLFSSLVHRCVLVERHRCRPDIDYAILWPSGESWHVYAVMHGYEHPFTPPASHPRVHKIILARPREALLTLIVALLPPCRARTIACHDATHMSLFRFWWETQWSRHRLSTFLPKISSTWVKVRSSIRFIKKR